jgi:hypothetical protein
MNPSNRAPTGTDASYNAAPPMKDDDDEEYDNIVSHDHCNEGDDARPGAFPIAGIN